MLKLTQSLICCTLLATFWAASAQESHAQIEAAQDSVGNLYVIGGVDDNLLDIWGEGGEVTIFETTPSRYHWHDFSDVRDIYISLGSGDDSVGIKQLRVPRLDVLFRRPRPR